MALKLAKAGWWGGDPGAVKRAPLDEVLTAVEYLDFTSDYEAAWIELGKALAGQ